MREELEVLESLLEQEHEPESIHLEFPLYDDDTDIHELLTSRIRYNYHKAEVKEILRECKDIFTHEEYLFYHRRLTAHQRLEDRFERNKNKNSEDSSTKYHKRMYVNLIIDEPRPISFRTK